LIDRPSICTSCDEEFCFGDDSRNFCSRIPESHISVAHRRRQAIMGIKELWAQALGDIKKRPPVAFSTLKGSTIGIDVSVFLHRYCHTDPVALCMNSVPKYPPTELLAKLKSDHRALVDSGITPYYCFDGFCHPMKKVARVERDNKYNRAVQWLESFYTDAREECPIDTERRELAMKYLRDVTVPNEMITSYLLEWMKSENIGHECSAMEAEWQLVKLEHDKRINAILTTDGDAIVLGGELVLFDVNFTKREFRGLRKRSFCVEMHHLQSIHRQHGQQSAACLDLTTTLGCPTLGSKGCLMCYPN